MSLKKSKYSRVVASSPSGMICVKDKLDDDDTDELAEIRLVIKNDFQLDSSHGFGPYFSCEIDKDDLDRLAVEWIANRYGWVFKDTPEKWPDESVH